MNLSRLQFSAASILTISLCIGGFVFAASAQQNSGDESQVQRHVDRLLRAMTIDEKIGQLTQLFATSSLEPLENMIVRGQLGSVLASDPAVINRLQHIAVDKSRLKIPLLIAADVIHGYRTIFPVPIGLAASWDPLLVRQAHSIAAREARANGIHLLFTPMVDISRDPRWGRIVEGAGEDPWLGSAMAAAQVRGLQGEGIGDPEHVLACMKHFAGYGASEGGRDYDAANLSEVQLRNIYFPPFASAVKAGVACAMTAYTDLNDIPGAANGWLLRDILRGEWNFRGFVVSDADAVSHLVTQGHAKNLSEAAVRALTAGVDIEIGFESTAYSQHLQKALASGRITAEQLDAAVRRVLEVKVRMGLFKNPYVNEDLASKISLAPAHRAASRSAAERSAVLLRNEGRLLPLRRGMHNRIAVIGPLADAARDTLGPWALDADVSETVTVVRGLREKLGDAAVVTSEPGVQIARKFPSFFDAIMKISAPPQWTAEQARERMKAAVDLARTADLVILVLGEAQNMAGMSASRQSLELPGEQNSLLQSVVATGKPVVLVLINGRPLDLQRTVDQVPAILEAWYPGTQGGAAIANLLYGDAVPGGKLPFTWPRNVGQVPMYYAHNRTQAPDEQDKRYWDEESTPLFPFGYGLTYSTFRIAKLEIKPARIRQGEIAEVSAEIENTGDTSADEVAQLYIGQRTGHVSRPVRELKSFERVTLSPGQSRFVKFRVGPEALRYWSSRTKTWVEEAATFDVWVGSDSRATLHGELEVIPRPKGRYTRKT
jgi:beta-glucosidase